MSSLQDWASIRQVWRLHHQTQQVRRKVRSESQIVNRRQMVTQNGKSFGDHRGTCGHEKDRIEKLKRGQRERGEIFVGPAFAGRLALLREMR